MIPRELRGGWVRNGISLDGGAEVEDAVVWWLQADSQHCDLRIPHAGGDGLMAFAGTTTWAAPRLTWHPELELDPSADEDVGAVTWDGTDLMESGVTVVDGREVTYVERWQRLPGSDAELWALRTDTGRIVRAGRYALTVVDGRPTGGAFGAVAWTLTDEGWSVHHRFPSDAAAPAPPVHLPSDRDVVLLDDGTEWIVDER